MKNLEIDTSGSLPPTSKYRCHSVPKVGEKYGFEKFACAHPVYRETEPLFCATRANSKIEAARVPHHLVVPTTTDLK
jgi:hypothetical protein